MNVCCCVGCFNLTPPYVNFYRAGLTALAAVSQGLHGKPFPELDGNDAHALVETMSEGFPDGWQGPPAPLFYVLVRSDAVDVVYGTPQGFDDSRYSLYAAYHAAGALVVMAAADKVDVVIAGAGAASSVYAAVLGRGRQTCVGPGNWARAQTDRFIQLGRFWARRLKWATAACGGEGRAPHLVGR